MDTQFWNNFEIRRYAGFDDARTDWLALENESEAYPFQRFGWLKIWQDTIGDARGIVPHIALYAGRGGGANAGSFLLPLGIRRRHGLKVLEWLGDGVSDYRGPLVCGPISGDAVYEAVLREARFLGADYASLANVAERGPRGRRNALTGEGARKLHYAAHGLEIPPDLEEYFSSIMTSKERYNLRRAEKKLASMGSLRFVADARGAECSSITECMIEQKRERYRLTGAVDNFAEAAFGDFYREAAKRGAPIPDAAAARTSGDAGAEGQAAAVPGMLGGLGGGAAVRVSALYLDDKVIACHWGVADRSDRTVYFLMPTFDAEYGRWSPGVIFLERFIADCAADGFRRLDFTIGDEIYKDKWCRDETPLYSITRGFSALGLIKAGSLNALEDLKSGPLMPLARSLKRSVLKKLKSGN